MAPTEGRRGMERERSAAGESHMPVLGAPAAILFTKYYSKNHCSQSTVATNLIRPSQNK
jgi:hypothetical protein